VFLLLAVTGLGVVPQMWKMPGDLPSAPNISSFLDSERKKEQENKKKLLGAAAAHFRAPKQTRLNRKPHTCSSDLSLTYGYPRAGDPGKRERSSRTRRKGPQQRCCRRARALQDGAAVQHAAVEHVATTPPCIADYEDDLEYGFALELEDISYEKRLKDFSLFLF